MQTYAFIDEETKARLLSETRGGVVIRRVCYNKRENLSVETLETLQRKIEQSKSFGELAWWLKQLGRTVALRYKERLLVLQHGVEVLDAESPHPSTPHGETAGNGDTDVEDYENTTGPEIEEARIREMFGWDFGDEDYP
jgi:hypothetical protein